LLHSRIEFEENLLGLRDIHLSQALRGFSTLRRVESPWKDKIDLATTIGWLL